MEELIAAKKHFSKIGWLYLAATIIIYGVQFGLALVVKAVAPQWLENGNISVLLGMLPMYLVGFPLLTLLLKRKVPVQKIEKRRMSAGQYVLSAIICIGLAYAANYVGTFLTFIVGCLRGEAVENQIMTVVDSIHPVMILIYMVICAPIVEEYIFRKLIVDRTVRYGQWIAVLTSGLMFGFYHGNLNQFVYATVIGMFLAFLYVKTGNLKITISLHMVFNFIGGFLSSRLIEMIDLGGYTEVALEGDMQAVMAHMTEHLIGWILFFSFFLFVVGMLITGIVLFIVFLAKKRFTFEPGEVFIPKELRYSIAFANMGMLAFIVFWIVQIVLQLFA